MNKKKLQYYANYIFLKRNFFLLLAISGFSYYWYTHYASLMGDNARVQIILSVISLIACGMILVFSIFTSLPPYLSLLFRKRILETDDAERKDIIKVNFKQINPAPGLVDTDIRIYGIRRPLLGFAKVRIIFDNLSQTEDVLLTRPIVENRRKVGIRGTKALRLPNIRDYRINSSMVHFEDFFHLFSLPYREAENVGIFTEPPRSSEGPLEIHTRSSEEPVKKVVQHRVAKGELLDYKKYAPGDDIRRIIWKNYARSRELTVRIHDRTFPYVSHINVLASFYDGAPPARQPVALKEFLLDIYKEKIRQVVDSIIEQDFTVQFFTDQPIVAHYQLEEYQQMLYTISASEWQGQMPPREFVRENYSRLRSGSTLFIFSSLCPVAELQGLSNGRPNAMDLCFYNAAETLAKSRPPSLLQRIFLVDPYEPLESAKRKHNARHTVQYISRNEGEFKKTYFQNNQTVLEL